MTLTVRWRPFHATLCFSMILSDFRKRPCQNGLKSLCVWQRFPPPFPPLKCWVRIRGSRNRPKHFRGGKGVERKFWNAKFSKVQLCQNMSILRRKLHVFSDCRVADHARPNVTVNFMCRGVFVGGGKFGSQSSRNVGPGENLEIARFSAENCMF